MNYHELCEEHIDKFHSPYLLELYNFCTSELQKCVEQVNNPLCKDLRMHYYSKFFGILTVLNKLCELYVDTATDEVFMKWYSWFIGETGEV